MRRTLLSPFAAVLILIGPGVATGLARTIKVTTTLDNDVAPVGACTLRDAITAANTDAAAGGCLAGDGSDRIKLGKSLTYLVSIAGTGDNANASGDLDIYGVLRIDGSGSTIDGGGLDGVMDVRSPLPPLPPSSVVLSNLRITGGNNPSDAGGLHCAESATCVLDDCMVDGNVATTGGGGIDCDSGALVVLNRTTVSGNRATSAGGGITCGSLASSSTRLILNQSTVSGNSTVTDGTPRTGNAGGVFIFNGCQALIVNSTVSGNKATGNPNALQGIAGGIGIAGELAPSRLEIVNSTVTNNDATLAGGIATFVLAAAGAGTESVLENTIVHGNRDLLGAKSCFRNSPAAIHTSLGHNLENLTEAPGPLPGSKVGCGFTGPGDQVLVADAKLGPLAANGGSTWIHALLAGSPAIDAANDLTCAADPVGGKDQRDVKRPQDIGCDIGAFEWTPISR